MHLGVVKVGLLRLAKPEVISQRIIFTKKNSTIDRTLTTPNNENFILSHQITVPAHQLIRENLMIMIMMYM